MEGAATLRGQCWGINLLRGEITVWNKCPVLKNKVMAFIFHSSGPVICPSLTHNESCVNYPLVNTVKTQSQARTPVLHARSFLAGSILS